MTLEHQDKYSFLFYDPCELSHAVVGIGSFLLGWQFAGLSSHKILGKQTLNVDLTKTIQNNN